MITLSSNTAFSQVLYKKNYKALLERNHKDRTDGSCEVSHYSTLSFSKNGYVNIINNTIFMCNPIELNKTYNDIAKPTNSRTSYKIKKGEILVKDFAYSPLKITKEGLKYSDAIVFKLRK